MPSAARIFGKLYSIDIPAMFCDEKTLLAHLDISPAELKKIWWYRRKMYRQFSIAKGPGKTRMIYAPDRRLKILQRKLAPLLGQIYRIRNPVHGFVLDRSVKTNAEAHGARRFVLNLDLQDFFPTITENRIVGLLTSVGLERRVAEIVARLACYEGHLPQGAPTSPVLSNMICYRLDTELLRIAKSARAIYTRYADDITFSGYQPPVPLFEVGPPAVGKFSPDLLAATLRAAVQGNGFTINPHKLHYADRNSRRIVTGVKINSGLNVDRRYVRDIRAKLNSIEKHGLKASQATYASKGGKGDIGSHIRGKIAYVAHLKGLADPVVRSLALRYNRSFADHPMKITPTDSERRDRSVWIVEHSGNGGEQGTAFFLSGVGLVTAAHCVEDPKDLLIYHPSTPSNQAQVSVRKRCQHHDLAILDHAISSNEFFEIEAATAEVAVGDDVVAYGYPGYGPGDGLNVRGGKVTSLPRKHAIDRVEVSQELSQGMSGGPVLDSSGKVVGVIHKGGPNEERQIATAIHELKKWAAS
ncbi:trypsin-like peptidase domain-containing protein [Tepidamorphus sp. 3E244]|uniref:trypsin-like peptidase domain-containing protein n=1 Tax=Tepidamorphus sp. 3E244 TaxID=3385498 RepID=UPI0038FCE429